VPISQGFSAGLQPQQVPIRRDDIQLPPRSQPFQTGPDGRLALAKAAASRCTAT